MEQLYKILSCAIFLFLSFMSQGYSLDELSQIKQTLADKRYGNYWDRMDAIKKLKALDSKEAGAMLISLLDDQEAPIREAAVMALGTFTNKETIDSLILVLINSKSKLQRLNSAWVLGLIKNQPVLDSLLKALNIEPDKEVIVRIIKSIGLLPNTPESEAQLIARLSDNDAKVRAASAEVLGNLRSQKSYPEIMKRLSDSNVMVRIATLDAIAFIKPLESISYLEKALKDPLPEIRIAAIENLAKSDADKTIITKAATDLLKDKSQAVRTTAKQILNIKIEPLPGETRPVFFGIPIIGNPIFIIDFSGSMKTLITTGENKGLCKIDVAIKELESALKQLPATSKFNIIFCSTEATGNQRMVSKTMLPATESNKSTALNFVKSLWNRLQDIKRGRGDHYDALIEALSEPELDTILLLSDGEPTYGTYIQNQNIIDNIQENNRFKKVVINTIVTGKTGTNLALMQKLAEMSNGICTKR